MSSDMTLLLQQLQALEVELHHPGVRCSRERLNQLLHAEFHEVGRSGCVYHRETIIDYLCTRDAQPTVASDAFAIVELAADVALLTYRSAQIVVGEGLANHALRSSVWTKSAAGWRLRYHQGTAAAQEW